MQIAPESEAGAADNGSSGGGGVGPAATANGGAAGNGEAGESAGAGASSSPKDDANGAASSAKKEQQQKQKQQPLPKRAPHPPMEAYHPVWSTSVWMYYDTVSDVRSATTTLVLCKLFLSALSVCPLLAWSRNGDTDASRMCFHLAVM